jgi:hypothetical protein
MPKGQKFGGRKKGIPNKKTAEQLSRAERLLRLLEQGLDEDIEKLSPAQRVALFSDMLEYASPKLSRQEVTGEGGGPVDHKFEITLKL